MLVPVLDKKKNQLMPCTCKRARLLMERKQAKSYWYKGIFCIQLLKDPSDTAKQPIVLGIDPGSKREGYTIATPKRVVFNITTNTPDKVKSNVETRRNLRKTRRSRKTPYRKCRFNRSVKNRIPPSTKARWDAKLRVISSLQKILPITFINVEDIQAVTKKGSLKWNKSFSPLEVGKKYFYNQIINKKLKLVTTKGFDTAARRKLRDFKKSSKKLEYKWESHNVDSHCLCEISLNKELQPENKLYKIEFLEFSRRQIHVQNPKKGGIRKLYGTTNSLGKSRGMLLRSKKTKELVYLGGTSKGKVSVHNLVTGKRLSQNCNLIDYDYLGVRKWKVQLI